MNEPDSGRKTKKWSAIRRCQVWGAILGSSITALFWILNFNSSSHNLVPMMLIELISIPSLPILLILKLFGFELIHQGEIEAVLCSVAVNAITYFLVGTMIGIIISAIRKQKI